MASSPSSLERIHRLSSAEYERMLDTGALDGVRVELLDGLLIDMSPQGERHVRVIQQLMRVFASRLDLLRVQMPLALAEGWVPKPDVALAYPQDDPERHPATALIVVEVAVTSQAEDRRKSLAYARADVPRYWLVDLPSRVVHVYEGPGAEGYASVSARRGDDVLDAGVESIGTSTVAELVAP